MNDVSRNRCGRKRQSEAVENPGRIESDRDFLCGNIPTVKSTSIVPTARESYKFPTFFDNHRHRPVLRDKL